MDRKKAIKAMIGLFLIVAGCFSIFYFSYLTIREIRGLIRVSYPFSAFSSPFVLYGVLFLIIAVIILWILTLGKNIWKEIQENPEWSKIIFTTGIFLFPLALLCMGIYYLCALGYQSYLEYRMVEIISASEYQVLKAREIIMKFAKQDILWGIFLVLAGISNWLLSEEIKRTFSDFKD
ncbi:MAG: hypothetical protein PVF58_13120 [Candidatus Methanofastidiosia archaeon]|jgi:hypothetical protein